MSKHKHVVIAGAGPGGLTFGMVLDHRGSRVTTLEQLDAVGGRKGELMPT